MSIQPTGTQLVHTTGPIFFLHFFEIYFGYMFFFIYVCECKYWDTLNRQSMKQSIKTFLLLLILSVSLASNANETYSYTFRFNESDFIFTQVSSDSIIIASKNEPQYYEESAYPAIPFIGRSIGVPIAQIPVISSVEVYTREVQNHIVLAKAPRPMTTNGLPVQKNLSDYNMKVYPDTIWDMDTPKTDGSVSLFRFVITPFKYDAVNQTLAFVDSVKFEFSTSTSADMNSVCNTDSPSTLNLALQHIENKEKISASSSYISTPLNNNDNTVDYLIVTADVLKDSYKPLLDWKRTKGLRSQMVTVEKIDSLVSGPSRLLRIKKYLEQQFNTNGLKYVLLAGDSCYIPVRLCKTNDEVYKDNIHNIPFNDSAADLFYACFDGAYDWDGNGNGIYGEKDDNIDFNPSICITRIPSLMTSDADVVVRRILEYEKTPRWNNNMLMGGNLLDRYVNSESTISDAEDKGRYLLETAVKPYWEGNVKTFFDTGTDFEGNQNYEFSVENLQYQFSKGYSFVSMITHGGVSSWAMEHIGDSIPEYHKEQSDSMFNPYHTIITTIACMTNFFDFVLDYPPTGNPCLSESLLRNPNSGVVAYLGSSREGWFYVFSRNGYSLDYESTFYKHLFMNDLQTSSFGELVTHSKLGMINFCRYDETHRNLQYSINPIGDPEMPIFTTKPKEMELPSITAVNDTVYFKAPSNGFKITLTSLESNERIILASDSSVICIPLNQLPEETTLCVTGRNYIPKVLSGIHYRYKKYKDFPQDKRYDYIIVGDAVKADSAADQYEEEHPVWIKAPIIVFCNELMLDENASIIFSNDNY